MLQRLIARLEPSNTSAVIVLDSQYGPGFVHIAKIHLSRQDSIGQAVSTHTTMRKGDFGSDQGSRRPRSHVFSSSCPQVIAAVGLLTLSVRILSARTYFLPDHPPTPFHRSSSSSSRTLRHTFFSRARGIAASGARLSTDSSPRTVSSCVILFASPPCTSFILRKSSDDAPLSGRLLHLPHDLRSHTGVSLFHIFVLSAWSKLLAAGGPLCPRRKKITPRKGRPV
jgi:hypothetical protein